MKKKIVSAIFIFVLISAGLIFGCKKQGVEDCFGEETLYYFYGENENISSSISVGKREKEYSQDGYSSELCDFSLIQVEGLVQTQNELVCTILINEKEEKLTLLYNPLNGFFVNDLGRKINQNDNVTLIIENAQINYENISNHFNIKNKDAIKIAKDYFKNEINSLYKNGKFEGEVYLRVVKSFDKNTLFYWYFCIQKRSGESRSVLITCVEGKIVS